MLVGLRESIESLRGFVATLDPAALDGDSAKELVAASAELERLAGAVRTLAAGRVAQTGAWANDGPFRDAAAWMADVAGVTIGRARATIETAERLVALPQVDAALRSGVLSEVQVDLITSAAVANPRAQATLLHSADIDGVKGLKQSCARVEAAASTDQAERYENARKDRFLRHRRISDVEGSIELRGPIDETARIYAALEPIEADLFTRARGCDPEDREPPEARAFDAMVLMADNSATVATESSGRRAPPTIVMRIDHNAFISGDTEEDEICEIVGVGPVPVAVVRKLADDAFFKALITDGTDVLAISHLSRTIPVRMRTALEELYPECVVAGCHVDRHLQIDHNVPVEERGPTALWNLNRVCNHHHALKTKGNLRLDGIGLHQRLVPGPRTPAGFLPP